MKKKKKSKGNTEKALPFIMVFVIGVIGGVFFHKHCLDRKPGREESALFPAVYRLELSADPGRIHAGEKGTSQVLAQLQDVKGNLCRKAAHQVTFTISGEGTWEDGSTMEKDVSPSGGVATIKIKPLREGAATVTASYPRVLRNLALYKNAVTNSEGRGRGSDTNDISRVVDGDVSTASYFDSQSGLHYVQIDLGLVRDDIDYLKVWHYYGDGRTYQDTKTEVSEDGLMWHTLFDSAVSGEYAETPQGRKVRVQPSRPFRYIRDWANGNSVNRDNHWVEIKAVSVSESVVDTTTVTITDGDAQG